MNRVLIIGDDLTGSNATGALYAQSGLSAVTVQTPLTDEDLTLDTDVLVVNTNSRHLSPRDAGEAVAAVINSFETLPRLVAKRIDTTLRGNVGAEIEALLNSVRAREPDKRIAALLVPAFPKSGRVTVGGMQLVEGEPVARTWAGSDPFTPVLHSSIAHVVADQADLATSEVKLDDLTLPTHELSQKLSGLALESDVIVIDAVNQNDLLTIAEAAVLAAGPDLDFVVADTGPFGAALCKSHGIRPEGDEGASGPVFALIGSLTSITEEQTRNLQRTLGASIITFAPASADLDQVLGQLKAAADAGDDIIALKTAPAPDEVVSPESSKKVMATMGEVATRVVQELEPRGLYATGGDVAMTVLEALGANGFKIEEEVLPLAVAGSVVGGPYNGLPFSTKGGLIGGPDAAVLCIEALVHLARTHRAN